VPLLLLLHSYNQCDCSVVFFMRLRGGFYAELYKAVVVRLVLITEVRVQYILTQWPLLICSVLLFLYVCLSNHMTLKTVGVMCLLISYYYIVQHFFVTFFFLDPKYVLY
jgi:hypothetical protein